MNSMQPKGGGYWGKNRSLVGSRKSGPSRINIPWLNFAGCQQLSRMMIIAIVKIPKRQKLFSPTKLQHISAFLIMHVTLLTRPGGRQPGHSKIHSYDFMAFINPVQYHFFKLFSLGYLRVEFCLVNLLPLFPSRHSLKSTPFASFLCFSKSCMCGCSPSAYQRLALSPDCPD